MGKFGTSDAEYSFDSISIHELKMLKLGYLIVVKLYNASSLYQYLPNYTTINKFDSGNDQQL